MLSPEENVPLAPHTTLGIGGPAEFFFEAKTAGDIKEAFAFGEAHRLPLTFIGGGSNLLIADEGLPGLVVSVQTKGLRIEGEKVVVRAGENLDDLVRTAISEERAGLEALVDIPGTVGGAIYGNAGAYGRTISDFLVTVTVWNGKDIQELSKEECGFSYRGSIFKKTPWVILGAEFSLLKLHRAMLENVANAIRAHRAIRYPKGLKVPGSFFKNVEVKDVPQGKLAEIPPYGIMANKVQTGFLLEAVGALGMKSGHVRISGHHANLLINEGGASAEEFLTLAEELWQRVYERFGVCLEPEVQLLGFKKEHFVLPRAS